MPDADLPIDLPIVHVRKAQKLMQKGPRQSAKLMPAIRHGECVVLRLPSLLIEYMSPHRSRARSAAFLSLLVFACAASAEDPAPTNDRTDLFASDQGSKADKHNYLVVINERDPYRLRAPVGWQRQRPGSPELALMPESIALAIPRTHVSLGRNRFDQEIARAARQAGLDPALVHAVIRVESGYQERAISPKGAVGLMQVIPSTGRRFGVEDLLQPSANIRAGTQYLSYLMYMFEGDLQLALAAYNAGENAVLRYGNRIPPYSETLRYVPRVLSIYRALSTQTPSISFEPREANSSSTVR